MYPGVIKAWHIHKKQTDWWYVSTGVLKIVLYDKRPESATYRQSPEVMLGDGYEPSILKIPPGVAHGCKCLRAAQPIFSTLLHIPTTRRTKVVFPTMIRKSGMTGLRDLRLCRSNQAVSKTGSFVGGNQLWHRADRSFRQILRDYEPLAFEALGSQATAFSSARPLCFEKPYSIPAGSWDRPELFPNWSRHCSRPRNLSGQPSATPPPVLPS